ncbi:uncharacterized protein BT62DRAFT_1070566 [Guyanagaster necrorhizus]|uniref:Uncharacterized protein n=1 Tax=Guyanagaster necrorhizus TaxID=856835 RepID=A0A9P7W6H6_9AGAR|nr:uncharacterized protein BT62DRAFT_1070566 [Guyanagaster necrorhizus MCA 3950]KAG7452850.1 hypothetical protein BT62DRAFT_1070566 [Guyanagaster necrorhizus MCA 3950]
MHFTGGEDNGTPQVRITYPVLDSCNSVMPLQSIFRQWFQFDRVALGTDVASLLRKKLDEKRDVRELAVYTDVSVRAFARLERRSSFFHTGLEIRQRHISQRERREPGGPVWTRLLQFQSAPQHLQERFKSIDFTNRRSLDSVSKSWLQEDEDRYNSFNLELLNDDVVVTKVDPLRFAGPVIFGVLMRSEYLWGPSQGLNVYYGAVTLSLLDDSKKSSLKKNKVENRRIMNLEYASQQFSPHVIYGCKKNGLWSPAHFSSESNDLEHDQFRLYGDYQKIGVGADKMRRRYTVCMLVKQWVVGIGFSSPAQVTTEFVRLDQKDSAWPGFLFRVEKETNPFTIVIPTAELWERLRWQEKEELARERRGFYELTEADRTRQQSRSWRRALQYLTPVYVKTKRGQTRESRAIMRM